MANNGSTKGAFGNVINKIRSEAQEEVKNIKQEVINTVRSEMGGISIDAGTVNAEIDVKVNGNLKNKLSEQIRRQIPSKVQQELELELTPTVVGKFHDINLDNLIQMNPKELKKKIDEYYDSAAEGSKSGTKRFIAGMKIAKFRGIDLDESIVGDYESLLEDVESAFSSYTEKLNKKLSEVDFSLITKSAQESTDYIVEAFKGIIKESKSAGSVEKFLKGIIDGSIEATDKVKGLLAIVQVLSNGKYSFSAIDEGTRHTDGFVSNEYTVIARESKYEEKTDALIPKLKQAEKAGVQLGTVIGTIKDDANGLFYEIQKTQKGKIINEDNLEFLEATDEQILKLKKDLQILQKLGLYVDTGGQNIMYSKEHGFSFIDLAMPKNDEKVPDYLKNDFEGITEAFEEYLPYNSKTFELTPEAQSSLNHFKREIIETAEVVEGQIKRIDSSIEKYNEVISKMKKPGFHVGNMEDNESYISDDFQSSQSLDRIGSGSFWMTDIDEALTLLEEKTEAGEKVKLYITDLGNVLDNMTHITSVDEYDEYTQFLGTFNKFVMAIATEGEESSEYIKKLNSQGITDLDSLYKNYKLYFDEFGITEDKLNEIVKDSVKYAKESIKSGDMVDDLSAYLQSKYMGLKGVTTKDVADLDNYGVGTVVFHKEDLGDIFAVDSKDQLSLDTVKNIFKQALLEKAKNDENTFGEFDELLNRYEDSPILKQLYSERELSDIISEMKKIHTEAKNGMMSIIEDYDAVDDVANERADRIRGLIVGNNDTRDYQGIDWLEEYEDRARAGFESVDDLYEEYVDRLERRKKELLDAESTNKNNLSSGTTSPSQIDEATDNIIEFKNKQEETINPDLQNGYERMADSISELGSEYKESEKFATEFLHAIQEIQDINKLPVLDDSQYNRMQEIYEQFPEVVEFFAKYPQYMNGWVDEDSIDDWFTFLETLPKAKEFLKVQEQISDFADYDEKVSNGNIHFDDEYLEEINQQLQQATGKEENFIEKYKEIIDLFSSGKIGEIQTIKSILEEEMPYYNYYVSEDTGFIKGIPKTRKEIEELGLSAKETSHIIEELYGETGQLKTESNEKIIDASHLFGRQSDETPVSTESTNAETKAFLSKKDVIERLRTELNLTKKAAEELFDAQDYRKSSKGQYEIEKEAVDELIGSYEELQKVKDTSDTIPSTDVGEIKKETKANLDLVDSMDKVDKEKTDDKTNQITSESAKLTAEEAQAMADLFDKAIKAAEAKDKFATANKEVLSSIIESLKGLNSEGNGFNQLNNLINKLSNKEIASQGDNLNQINKAKSVRQNTAKTNDGSKEEVEEVSNVEKAIAAYEKLYNARIKQAGIPSGTRLGEYDQLSNKIREAENEIQNIILTSEESAQVAKEVADLKIKSENAVAEASRKEEVSIQKQIESAKKLQATIRNQATSMMQNGKLMKEYGDDVKSALADIDSLNIEANPKEALSTLFQIQVKLKGISSAAKEAGKSGKTFGQMLVERFKSLGTYLATFVQFYDIVRYTRQAFETIRDLDYQLVDLRKTTTMTTTELEQFYHASADIGKQLGVTSSEIISQASAWSRLGYSTKEAATQMAQLSSQFATVSPGMTTEQSTDYLVSTMQAYGIAVDDVERKIMDNVNKIGNTFATTNAEIGEMLTRSSAAMKAANNSLEETIALESAAVEVTRNAETTGTAFRTVSMRIRGLDEETEEALEDYDELKGKIADLTKTKSTPGGVSLFTNASKTEYKSTYQFLKDIANIWDELDDKRQASLLETIAGKRGGQVLAGILNDFSRVDDALKNMEDAAGSADAEMSIVQDSIDYKLNALKQTWIGVLTEITDRGDIGEIIDFLTNISEGLGGVISKIGVLNTALISIGTVVGSRKLGYCN